jgi:DNA polymerase
MFKRSKGGTTPNTTWIEPITIRTTSLETFGLSHDKIMYTTGEALKNCRRKLQTYDLAYAGPRNRFTILTARGPVIVHNCGYGMGATKFQIQLKSFGTTVSDGEAAHIIQTYRNTYPKVPELWKQAQAAIEAMATNQSVPLGNNCVAVSGMDGVLMPNGLYQRYPNLRKIIDEDGKEQYVYDSRKGINKIYGGKLVENICQGLARCVIGEQMVRIAKRYKVVLTVHDAIACIAPKTEADEAKAYVEECMRWVPDWAEGLPLNCEAGYGENYGST